jgi:Cu(I)/Ag(I) efflux system membrane fusion protein
MKRILLVCVAAAALSAAAVGGLMVVKPELLPFRPSPTMTATAHEGTVIYYRHPDGLPNYSLTPAKTSDRRAYLPVLKDADINFDLAEQEPTAAPPAAVNRKLKYYRNPMGLPDTSPVPKKDSMGMDYIPVYDDEDVGDGTIKISPGKIQKTGVRSEQVERRVLNVPVRAPGTIELDERRVSIVSFRFEGFIESVENVTTGQHVHKGQRLMRVYSPALASAAAEYVSVHGAKAGSGITSQGIKGARRRLENLGMSEQAIADIERTGELSLSVPWLAPQDGEILERNAVNGMRAAPGAVLFRIADHQVVWAIADIAERDLGLISIGQKVSVRPRAYPNRIFGGKVALIYPHMNAQTRTARIRVELPNPEELLRPDMYADIEVATGTEAPVVTVPDSAVIDSGQRQVVLLDKGEGRFEPRAVKLGRRGDGRVEIKEGVSEDDKVVVTANFLIDAESNLKAALQGFDSAEKPQ